MSFTKEAAEKIASLARLRTENIDAFAAQLSRIIDFIAEMDQTDTKNIQPLAHPFDASQRLRADVVTEENSRAKFQAIAPQVEARLYLVPKVIEEG